jgi:glycosyltransferase involved in cell wall biosynthesis
MGLGQAIMTAKYFDPQKIGLVDISIVTAMYNEADGLSEFLSQTCKVLEEIGLTFEIVAVNDGSADQTYELLREECRRNPLLRVFSLSRNFGKEAALTAAIEHAYGKAVIPIDADLQHPPATIKEMVAFWQQGYEVVLGVRASRAGESWFKRKTAAGFYRVVNSISRTPIPPGVGDFRLMDRKVVEALRTLRETSRFMKGLFGWLGFKTARVTYPQSPRFAGSSKWRYWKLWNFALDGFIGFSQVPLQIWTYLGGLIAIGSGAYAAYIIVKVLISGIDLPGYPSLMAAILFLGGVQLISLGIIGEYVGRILIEAKRRPVYIVSHCDSGDGQN